MWRLHPSYGNSSFISTGFLFIVLFVSRTGFAQLTRGTISGTVADSTNSVITNALVTARSLSTSQERQVRTNQEGFFRFSALEPDSYTVEIASDGFERKRIANVRVGPSDNIVLNETLAIAGTEVTIDRKSVV